MLVAQDVQNPRSAAGSETRVLFTGLITATRVPPAMRRMRTTTNGLPATALSFAIESTSPSAMVDNKLIDSLNNEIEHLEGQTRVDPYPEGAFRDNFGICQFTDNPNVVAFVCRLSA